MTPKGDYILHNCLSLLYAGQIGGASLVVLKDKVDNCDKQRDYKLL